jgi:hypothetical protein
MRKPAMQFVLLAMVALVPPASAADRLSPLLRYVPLDALSEGVRAPIAFVDLAAIRAVEEAGNASEDWREMDSLVRVWAMPAMLHDYLTAFTQHEFATTADYLGFAWNDIEAAVGFGNPPGQVMVIAGTPAVTDAAAIGATLTGRGFAAEDRGGHPFWWRLDDNAIDIQNRDPADPLRGHLGGSARAGLVDDAFVAAANWPSVDAAVAAFDGERPALAESEDFAAIVAAVGHPVTEEGTLLQAYLAAGAFDADFTIDVLMRGESEELIAELRRRLEGNDGSALPRYSAIAIADRQEGERAVGVVALVYANREQAELATRLVPESVATQESLATRTPFSEILPYPIETAVVEAPSGQRYVALIGFIGPPEDTEAEPSARLPFRHLVTMMFGGDMGPFVTGSR